MIDSMTRDDVLSALGEISKHFESCTKGTYGSTREMFHRWMNAADWAAAYLNDPAPPIVGWISVKDRLPPMEKCVLVFCKGKSEHTQSVRTITEMSDINRFNYKCKTEPYWREPWDFFYANYDITHWMPLPEPPEENEDD